MPKGLDDRPTEQWTGTAEHCRQLLIELAERELAQLRPREEVLRVNYEVPAREGAEVRKQVLQGPIGARLLREAESHERHFHRAYDAFLKGRARTEKSGRLPGAPMEDVHGEPVVKTAAVVPDPGAVERGRAERREAAAKVAPGGENGIGPRIPRGDIERAAVKATNPMSMAEYEAAMPGRGGGGGGEGGRLTAGSVDDRTGEGEDRQNDGDGDQRPYPRSSHGDFRGGPLLGKAGLFLDAT